MIAPDAEVHVLEPYRAKHGTVHSTVPHTNAHGDGDTLSPQRRAAITADAMATTDINLSLLWRELARGLSNIVDSFFSEERCYLVLSSKTDDHATPVEGRRLEILEAVLSGLRQKNIAIDLALAPSTVALNSRLALESLGITCKPSRAHPLLMLAAKSVSEPTLALAQCSTFVTDDARALRVVGIDRPDRRLQALLPSAELAVIRSLIEGLSYQEIARRRGTSTRTIANQITAVFRRLRVSGRNELVQRLFSDEATCNGALAPRAETLVPNPRDRARTSSLGNVRHSA